MKLTDEQKEVVSRWADEDEISMGEVQKRLKSEFDVSLTYLETRFLLEDHGIALRVKEKPAEEPDKELGGASDDIDEVEAILDGDSDDAGDVWEEPGQQGGGGVSVTLDAVTQPQAMVSGKVSFSDGQSADWYVDQMGRLGLDPATPGYRPSEQDVMAFQQELQRVMSGG